jgi:hypothetical protein
MQIDGKRYSHVSYGKWSFFDLEQALELPPGKYHEMDRGRSDWSVDGCWIAYSMVSR